MFAIALFTAFASLIFVLYNPTIACEFDETFSDGEVFIPENDAYDFKVLTLKIPNTKNFTAKRISSGHFLLVDETGNKCVNIIEWDKIIHSKRDGMESFFKSELDKPSWSVDGVVVHQIDFISSDSMYSAYAKDSSKNTVVYIATPDEKDTAEMMNSLEFK